MLRPADSQSLSPRCTYPARNAETRDSFGHMQYNCDKDLSQARSFVATSIILASTNDILKFGFTSAAHVEGTLLVPRRQGKAMKPTGAHLHFLRFSMFSARLSIAIFVLAAASHAVSSRLPARQNANCGPNFDGNPVSIFSGVDAAEELAVASDTVGASIITQPVIVGTPQFLVENTGDFPSSYIIKDENDLNLVVYAASTSVGPALQLNEIDNTGEDQRQDWLISCEACSAPGETLPPGFAYGTFCQIENSNVGLCVQWNGAIGTPPTLTACNDAEQSQKFIFVQE
ncbi:hypothetical protein DFH07DRAFT_174486 [Mycena maculata]|uniref:Uncharacterized protein n=1 Tax=Mycena maculata TaxID=230809 RepID=A0AAD7HX62_9AGAR|nr:hypothetical protein DFH07DRAFT_174486 [Mycena maculata]